MAALRGKELAGMFPRTIGQSGWNKRLRKAFFLFIRVIRMLAMDTVAVER